MTKKSLPADVLSLILVALLLSLIYAATTRPGQDWGGDFAQYLNHARNLAEGRPYAETLYRATFPDAVVHMPATYPPVFPLLLAPIYAHYGLNYAPMKVLTAGMFVLAALLTFVIARLSGLPAGLAAAAALGFGTSGLVLATKDLVLSDGAYLFFAGLALAVAMWVERSGRRASHPVVSAILVLAPMLAAYGARAIGLSLLLGFVLYSLVKRRYGWFEGIVVIGFLAGIAIYSATFYNTQSYRSGFEHNLHSYLQNVASYARGPAALWAGSPAWLRYPLFGLTAVVAALEWVRRILSQRTILEFYVFASIAPLLAYSTAGSTRYLLPVLALYFIYFFAGLLTLVRRFERLSWLPSAACLLLAAGAVFNLRGMQKGPYEQGVEQASFTELCGYITRNVGPDALLVSWNPRVLALYTHLPSAWYPQGATDRDLDDYLRQVKAAYVLVYSGNLDDARTLGPHMRSDRDFAAAYRNEDFILYRRATQP